MNEIIYNVILIICSLGSFGDLLNYRHNVFDSKVWEMGAFSKTCTVASRALKITPDTGLILGLRARHGLPRSGRKSGICSLARVGCSVDRHPGSPVQGAPSGWSALVDVHQPRLVDVHRESDKKTEEGEREKREKREYSSNIVFFRFNSRRVRTREPPCVLRRSGRSHDPIGKAEKGAEGLF